MSIHEDWKDPQAPRTGMSTAVKVLLIVGGIGACFMLLCCGGGVVLFWKAKDAIAQAASTTDPDEIQAHADRIAQIEIPPDFEPTRGFDLSVIRWAAFEKVPRDGSRLLLSGFEAPAPSGKSLSEQRKEMEQAFAQPAMPFPRFEMPIDVSERSTRQLTVRGVPVEFEFNKGNSEGKAVRQVVGAFKTPGGIGVLNLIVAEANYDEAAIVKMIESIGDPVGEVEVEVDDDAAEMKGDEAKPGTGETPPQEAPGEEAPVDKGADKEQAGSTSN